MREVVAMQWRAWVPWVILVLGVPGCESPSEAPGEQYSLLTGGAQEVTVRYGDEVAVNGSVIRVAFGEVLSDSRCAVDVTCVWAGNAEVQLGIRAGMGPTYALLVNTTLEPRFADWQGIRVTLLELKPAPRSDRPIRPEDYSVRLKLESRP
jgi:hypothetical protein